MKDLSKVSQQEQKDFFDSFDTVISDIDGVIMWHPFRKIPGVDLGFKAFKKLGKKFAFLSNNSTKTLKTHVDLLKQADCDVSEDDVIAPIHAIVHYLKKINFTKKIYVIGMWCVKETLKNAGFDVVPDDILPDRVEETLVDFLKALNRDKDVGAVIFEGDLNVNLLKLQQAVAFLKQPSVLFITGATDSKLAANPDLAIIGPGYFLPAILDITGREPYALGKPSKNLNDYAKEMLKIQDESRVLFIGDSIPSDMAFASNCGYKKLLVLSGLTEKRDLDAWTWPEQHKPDYYIDSLHAINEIVEKLP